MVTEHECLENVLMARVLMADQDMCAPSRQKQTKPMMTQLSARRIEDLEVLCSNPTQDKRMYHSHMSG